MELMSSAVAKQRFREASVNLREDLIRILAYGYRDSDKFNKFAEEIVDIVFECITCRSKETERPLTKNFYKTNLTCTMTGTLKGAEKDLIKFLSNRAYGDDYFNIDFRLQKSLYALYSDFAESFLVPLLGDTRVERSSVRSIFYKFIDKYRHS